jgi:hypothetical protein
MKKIVIIILLCFSMQFGFSQTYQFKTTSVATSQKNKKGTWLPWTKPLNTSIIIKADGEKHRFVIYSEVIQLFEILKYEEPKETEAESTNIYLCKDFQGLSCVISIVTSKKLGNTKQFYITYDNSAIVYNVLFLGENN